MLDVGLYFFQLKVVFHYLISFLFTKV